MRTSGRWRGLFSHTQPDKPEPHRRSITSDSLSVQLPQAIRESAGDGNPLDDIGALRRLSAVILNGAIVGETADIADGPA